MCRIDERFRTKAGSLRILQAEGVLGRFSIDWVSVPTVHGWRHDAIEINLGKGGTTLPDQMLQFLTAGLIDEDTGESASSGTGALLSARPTIRSTSACRLSEDLMDILVERHLHFDESTEKGVVFSLISARVSRQAGPGRDRRDAGGRRRLGRRDGRRAAEEGGGNMREDVMGFSLLDADALHKRVAPRQPVTTMTTTRPLAAAPLTDPDPLPVGGGSSRQENRAMRLLGTDSPDRALG